MATDASFFLRRDTRMNTWSPQFIADPGVDALFYLVNSTGLFAAMNLPIAATFGGTGFDSYAVGDLLYASTTSALSKLADIATGNALLSGGIGVAPAWGKVTPSHFSGVLPVANGGTGLSTVASGKLLYASVLDTLAELSIGTSLAITTGTLDAIQDIRTSASPRFSRLFNTLGVQYSAQMAVAIGDSFTYGSGASNRLTTAWVPLVSAETAWTIDNQGVPGRMVADGAVTTYGYTPASGSRFFYWFGVNDEVRYSASNQQAIFSQGQIEQLAWLSLLPGYNKLLATSSAITYAGTWAPSSFFVTIGKQSTTNASTATFTVIGPVVLISYTAKDGNGGQFSVTVDGVSRGTVNCFSSGTINTFAGVDYIPQLFAITGLSDTMHTVVITVASATGAGNIVAINWVGAIGGVGLDKRSPRVYTADVTHMEPAGYAFWGGSDANVNRFNDIIRNNVALLASWGANVVLARVSAFVDPATDLNADLIHPNDLGHAKIAAAFESLINEVDYPQERQSAQLPIANVRWTPTEFQVWCDTGTSFRKQLSIAPGLASLTNNDSAPGMIASLGGLYLAFADGVAPFIQSDAFATNGGIITRRANGTAASPTQLLTGNSLGTWQWRGYHSGGAYTSAIVQMNVTASQDFTSSAQGTIWAFLKSKTGGTSASELFRGTENNDLLVGTTDSAGLAGTGNIRAIKAVHSVSNASAPGALASTDGMYIARLDGEIPAYQADAWATQPLIVQRRANNTSASPSAIVSGNFLGQIQWRGHDGSAYTGSRARIDVLAEENWVAGSAGGTGVVINTTLNATTTLAQRFKINGLGSVLLGALSALATNATDGFIYVPTCAGTPTGAPTSATGLAPIVIDSTNNKLYFYSGGAWRDAGP